MRLQGPSSPPVLSCGCTSESPEEPYQSTDDQTPPHTNEVRTPRDKAQVLAFLKYSPDSNVPPDLKTTDSLVHPYLLMRKRRLRDEL